MSRVRVGLAKQKNYMKDGCDLMRKGMKVFAAVIAAATASTMSLSAFAAPGIVMGETQYNGDNVTVTTHVTEAAPGEQVAYLVYKTGTQPTDDGSIIYINQVQANASGEADFSFTAARSLVMEGAGSTIKVGTTSTANNDDLTETLQVSNFAVIYSTDGNGKVSVLPTGGETQASGSTSTTGEVSFALAPNPGYKFSKVMVNGTEKLPVLTENGNVATLTISSDAAVQFEFAPKTGEAVQATSSYGGSVTYAAAGNNSACAYGKATGVIKEAGMFICADKATLDNQKLRKDANFVESGHRIGKFIALAVGSDGSFAIDLKEDLTKSKPAYEPFITSETMYAVTYVVDSEDNVSYGEVLQILAAAPSAD